MKEKSYHISRFTFFLRYLIIAVLLAGALIAYRLNMSYAIYVSAGGLAILGLIVFELRIRSNKVVLEKDVILIESGLFSKKITKINYSNISDIRVRQSFFQRILHYGNIEIGVPGSNLQQNFTGQGNVNVTTSGLHPGITLEKFQNIRSIEKTVMSKISEFHKARR